MSRKLAALRAAVALSQRDIERAKAEAARDAAMYGTIGRTIADLVPTVANVGEKFIGAYDNRALEEAQNIAMTNSGVIDPVSKTPGEYTVTPEEYARQIASGAKNLQAPQKSGDAINDFFSDPFGIQSRANARASNRLTGTLASQIHNNRIDAEKRALDEMFKRGDLKNKQDRLGVERDALLWKKFDGDRNYRLKEEGQKKQFGLMEDRLILDETIFQRTANREDYKAKNDAAHKWASLKSSERIDNERIRIEEAKLKQAEERATAEAEEFDRKMELEYAKLDRKSNKPQPKLSDTPYGVKVLERDTKLLDADASINFIRKDLAEYVRKYGDDFSLADSIHKKIISGTPLAGEEEQKYADLVSNISEMAALSWNTLRSDAPSESENKKIAPLEPKKEDTIPILLGKINSIQRTISNRRKSIRLEAMSQGYDVTTLDRASINPEGKAAKPFSWEESEEEE